MPALSTEGNQQISEIAKRHGFSMPATFAMFEALRRGNGTMAQFNDPEFAGPGQWMRGGMTMVSDMFNDRLKSRVDALCADLVDLLSGEASRTRESSPATPPAATTGGDFAEAPQASVVIPPLHGDASDWWPAELGVPSSTGAQNNARYAYFDALHRLAIDLRGTVTVFDTLDHQLSGFAQQQSTGGTISFTSQHGLVNVAKLPVVSVRGG